MKTPPSNTISLEIVILAIPLLLTAVFWPHFPNRIPTHWNIHGIANGWMDKKMGLLFLPGVNFGIWILFLFVPWLDPKIRLNPDDYERTLSVLRIWRLTFTVFFSFLALLILAAAVGISVDMIQTISNGVLLMFLIIGNFLGNLRPNYFAGIRTPWTLNEPDIWRATHRMGGRIMVYGSLFLFLVQYFLTGEQLIAVLIVYGFGLPVWAFGYSYYLFHRKTNKSFEG